MITRGDLHQAKWEMEGATVHLQDGGWRIWYRCKDYPRLTRMDERTSLQHDVTIMCFVDGGHSATVDDMIDRLNAAPAPMRAGYAA